MLRKLMPHALIILSMMYFVFFFIDRVNASMGFINNKITKGLLFALCALAVCQSVLVIREQRRRERLLVQRSQAKAAQAKVASLAKSAAQAKRPAASKSASMAKPAAQAKPAARARQATVGRASARR